MKNVTIEDVAEDANVSKSTVSAVLNNRDVVKDTTRERVLESIDKLNYQRQGAARKGFTSLRGRSIGFVVKEADNPYYSEILTGIQDVVREQECLTYMSSSEGQAESEKKIVRQFSHKDLDGLIITPILNDQSDLSHIFELKRTDIPFVLLEDVQGIKANLVDIDNVQASCEAVSHAIELGHERVLHFGGPEYSKHSQERIEGVRCAFSRSPLVFDDGVVVRVGDSLEKGYEHTLKRFGEDEDPPTAVTCYNDLVALGVIKGLKELGLRVPEDVSVIGFDDLKVLNHSLISLTTIHVPKYEMGRRAAELLLEQFQDGTEPPRQITLDAELVVRASTAPPQS